MPLSPLHVRTAAVAAAAAALLGALPAHAVAIYGLTSTNALFSFDSASPGNASVPMAITGLAVGERMLAIDLRPTTNMLYGVSSGSNVYSINAMTGLATMVGMLDAPLVGHSIGIDFNPAADLAGGASLRVISSSGQNYAFNVGTGANASGEGAISGGITSVAYANNDVSPATGTALYYVDAATDTLLVATGNFNNTMAAPITINPVGALGVDANGLSGFDIFGASTGYAAFTNADTGQSMLYGIDLTTGAASAMGSFGILGNTAVAPPILGLTVAAAVPEPGSYAMLLAGLAMVGGLVRRRARAGKD